MLVVYIAHPLGDGPDRAENLKLAAEWVVRAADSGVAPVAPWIQIASVWPETRRTEGLAIDLAVIERADMVWLCGPRVSRGMLIEADHAMHHGKKVVRATWEADQLSLRPYTP